jgi:hypothetical protein
MTISSRCALPFGGSDVQRTLESLELRVGAYASGQLVASCAIQMPAVSSSATSIDKKNKPAAEAPNKPTATVATSAGTRCPLCTHQSARELPPANLRQHQEGRTCM